MDFSNFSSCESNPHASRTLIRSHRAEHSLSGSAGSPRSGSAKARYVPRKRNRIGVRATARAPACNAQTSKCFPPSFKLSWMSSIARCEPFFLGALPQQAVRQLGQVHVRSYSSQALSCREVVIWMQSWILPDVAIMPIQRDARSPACYVMSTLCISPCTTLVCLRWLLIFPMVTVNPLLVNVLFVFQVPSANPRPCNVSLCTVHVVRLPVRHASRRRGAGTKTAWQSPISFKDRMNNGWITENTTMNYIGNITHTVDKHSKT